MAVDHYIAILQTVACYLSRLIQNHHCPSLAKDGNTNLGFFLLCFSSVHFCRDKIQRCLGYSFRAELFLPLQGDIPFW